MNTERCEYFRRAFPVRGTTRFEVQFCTAPKGMASDQNCGGYEEFCKIKQYKAEKK